MQQLIFGVLTLSSFGFFAFNLRKIAQNIHMGLPLDRSDRKADRWRTMLLVALGQKKMFTRPIPALLHLALYASFVITQIELIEILVDGISGSHRFFKIALVVFTLSWSASLKCCLFWPLLVR